MSPRRAAGRRIAEALLDPLVRGLHVVTGRGPAPAAEPPAVADAQPPARAATGEDAAARIDAARERLRSKIAPPADDDPAQPPAYQ